MVRSHTLYPAELRGQIVPRSRPAYAYLEFDGTRALLSATGLSEWWTSAVSIRVHPGLQPGALPFELLVRGNLLVRPAGIGRVVWHVG